MKESKKFLKALWNRNKESYRNEEVGSGVQKFVKKVLNCDEIFALNEGEPSTPIECRKNEFLEEKTKKNKRADVIIFVDSERIVPVEIEKYGNIKVGESQLFEYQRVWEKKYGLLTDGYEWRFYNNNILLKTFTVNQIFENTQLFLEYWKEYTRLENYYLNFFEKLGQLERFEEDIAVGKNLENFFRDITTLINGFRIKLKFKGFFEKLGEKESERKAVENTYAYLIQFILYKTLVDNEFENFKEDFDKRLQRIHKNLKTKNYNDIFTAIKDISEIISENIYKPFSEEQEFINRKLKIISRKAEHKLNDVTPWLDIFIFIKRYNFANVRNDIFGYIYENYLKALYEDEQKGQYFTDPLIVDFMLDKAGYSPKQLTKRLKEDKNSISIIDPACGSGTFLYSAVRNLINAIPNGSFQSSRKIENLVNDNFFGLDIAGFPLYLAEMSILMRMLPLIINEKYNNPMDKKIKVFLTQDSISEFLDTSLLNTQTSIEIDRQKEGGTPFLFIKQTGLGYESQVRDEDDLKEMKRSTESSQDIPRRRFDFVVGNPPYISYQKCKNQGIKIARLIPNKAHMNNIYGVNLNTVPGFTKPYQPKPNLYSFFIALGLALLKDNGTLCYIIPQTMLVNNDLDVIRYHLAKFVTIEEIIIFGGKMFIGRGIKQDKPVATSSLILILKNKYPKNTHKVKVIHYKDPNDDIEICLRNISKNTKVSKRNVEQKCLLDNVFNWKFIMFNKMEKEFYNTYVTNSETLDIYRDYSISKKRFGDIFIIDGSINIMKKDLLTKIDSSDANYYKVFSFSKTYKMELLGYHPKNKKIKIAKGSQGLIVIQPRYKVYWRYVNHNHFYFISGKDILPMYQQYCIASNHQKEIFYLFAILNSPVVNLVLNANLKVENEDKLRFLLGVRFIKEFVRVPIIEKFNQAIKDEIIKYSEKMLLLEDISVSDLVDFSNILMRIFDDVEIANNQMILFRNNKQIKCKIRANHDMLAKFVSSFKQGKVFSAKKQISLSEFKSMKIVDIEKQSKLKDYIDDLVFALYFDVKLEKIGVKNVIKIKKACRRNKFYKWLHQLNNRNF